MELQPGSSEDSHQTQSLSATREWLQYVNEQNAKKSTTRIPPLVTTCHTHNCINAAWNWDPNLHMSIKSKHLEYILLKF